METQEVRYGSRTWGQEVRTVREVTGLSTAQLNNALLCAFELCGQAPTRFYVHTYTQLRATSFTVSPICKSISFFVCWNIPGLWELWR